MSAVEYAVFRFFNKRFDEKSKALWNVLLKELLAAFFFLLSMHAASKTRREARSEV